MTFPGLRTPLRQALSLMLCAMAWTCDGPPTEDMVETEAAYRPTAATAPSTDIYLGVLRNEGEALTVVDVINVTNRPGYDNQPQFGPGGALFYTSARDTVQTDIYRMDIGSGTHLRLTRTDGASEFSATILPDGSGFSTIHEDAESQQLWHFGLDGTSRGGLFGDVQPVGYHAWLDEATVVAFVLGNDSTPPTLQLADLEGHREVLLEHPGRSLHRLPDGGGVSFVHKESEDRWVIKTLDSTRSRIETLTTTLPGREDYAWLPDGSILMGRDAGLYRWQPGGQWTQVADLAPQGVQGISRLAVSADGTRVAVVATRADDGS